MWQVPATGTETEVDVAPTGRAPPLTGAVSDALDAGVRQLVIAVAVTTTMATQASAVRICMIRILSFRSPGGPYIPPEQPMEIRLNSPYGRRSPTRHRFSAIPGAPRVRARRGKAKAAGANRET
jgi:hypothetical protein